MEHASTSLPLGYEIREMSWAEFEPIWIPLVKRHFDDVSLGFPLFDFLSDPQKDLYRELGQRLSSRLYLCFAVFHHDEIVAWSWGYQETTETFYMRNSFVMPAHRRKGLYRSLCSTLLAKALAAGFLRVLSSHSVSNNPILIAKLKLGFKVSGFEMTPSHGSLIRLSYFATEIQNQVFDFRSGYARPDAKLKSVFKLE